MSDLYGVLDKNVRPGAERTHTMPLGDGQSAIYTYKHNTQTQVPSNHAVKFQAEAAFQVYNPRGELLPTTISKHPLQAQAGDVKLKDGQTVALLEELTRDALYARVQFFPGGEKFKPIAKRDDLIDFLKGLAPVSDRLGRAADAGEADPEDVLNNEELDKMLPSGPDKDSAMFGGDD